MARVAFVGLGVMGAPMAGHLAAAGHDVTVYNRTRSKADQWVRQHDNASAPTPAEAAEGAELVMTCVGNDDDVRAVDARRRRRARRDGRRVDRSSTTRRRRRRSPASWRRRAPSAASGSSTRPVSGGQAGAENGRLTVMCGSDDAGRRSSAARPVIEAYAAKVRADSARPVPGS